MEAALRAVNVPTKLIRAIRAAVMAPPSRSRETNEPHPALPNALDEMVRWLNQHLK